MVFHTVDESRFQQLAATFGKKIKRKRIICNKNSIDVRNKVKGSLCMHILVFGLYLEAGILAAIGTWHWDKHEKSLGCY